MVKDLYEKNVISDSNILLNDKTSDAIASYMEAVEKADCDALRKEAEEYNQKLLQKENRWDLTEDEKAEYDNLLNVAGNGILGHISIPKIDVSLPIYHGTEKYINKGYIVHYIGTSFPVGGQRGKSKGLVLREGRVK